MSSVDGRQTGGSMPGNTPDPTRVRLAILDDHEVLLDSLSS